MQKEEPCGVRIGPGGEGFVQGLRELWAYRELLWFLVIRDINVRYRQTVLGGLWALLQPLCAMVVFSVFLGKLVGVPSEGHPYPLFVFAALLPWQLFSTALTQAGNVLVAEQKMLTKVYFPRLLLPLSALLSGVLDFLLSLGVLLGLMAYYHVWPTSRLLFLPLLVGLALLTALSVGLWVSALNVRYRDFRYTLPFLSQCWLWVTPVVYSSTILPGPWRVWYGLNPMVGVVDGFRWTLLGGSGTATLPFLASLAAVLFLLAGGWWYFYRVEGILADIV